MRTAVQVNDSRVVDHLGVHQNGVPGLNDLVVAVVGIRQHRRPGGERTPDTDPEGPDPGRSRALHRLDTPALDLGSRGRERGNAAVGRVGDDRRAERLDDAGAELAEERVVGAGAGVLRARPAAEAPRCAAATWRSHSAASSGVKKALSFNCARPFERRGRRGVPDALEARMIVATALVPRRARARGSTRLPAGTISSVAIIQVRPGAA